MTIQYKSHTRPAPADVLRLLHQTTWAKNRTLAPVAAMIERSLCVSATTADGRLVGFARALTDGHYRAFIEDVVVDEAHRGQGIGRGLVETLLAELTTIEEIILACSDENISFYERFGFAGSTGNYMHIWRGA